MEWSWRTYHLGETNVDYNIDCGKDQCKVTFDLFVRDGFWDPNYLMEWTLGYELLDNIFYMPDGPGPALEIPGGTPFFYIPETIEYNFPNPGYDY